MADIFISYSRRDKDFVEVLHNALRASQYETWIDWQDIEPTTEWWKEIEAGIEAAHTFIFIISQDSVTSKYCQKEIDHAVEHGKRLIPVLRRRDFVQNDMHPKLGQHQWISFREEDDFEVSFTALVKAIDTDLEHKKTHTRLELRAIEWIQKNRDASYLLRGSDLEAAEQWLIQSSGGKTPEPTPLQRDYVSASATGRQLANTRQRLVSGVLATLLLLASVAGGLAFLQYRNAQAALAEKGEALTREEEARELAEQRLQEAERAKELTQTAKEGEAMQRRIAETKQKVAETA